MANQAVQGAVLAAFADAIADGATLQKAFNAAALAAKAAKPKPKAAKK